MTLPRLDGVPYQLKATLDSKTACQYASAFVQADVFPPDLWSGDVIDFLNRGLVEFLERNGSGDVRRRFSLSGGLGTSVGTSYGLREEKSDPMDELFVSFGVQDTIGIVQVGDTFERLEVLGQGLGVSFIWMFLQAVNRAWPTFDFRDADSMYENLQDISLENIAYETEMASKEGRKPETQQYVEQPLTIPPALLRPGKLMPFCQMEAAAARGNKTDKLLISRLAELVAASKLFRGCLSRDSYIELRDRYFDGADGPMPVTSIRMYDDDEMSGLLDRFLEGSGEVDHEPCYLDVICGPSRTAVRKVMNRLGAAVGILAAASRLIDAMPGNRSTTMRED